MYLTAILSSQHRKALFSCGKALLDGYLHHQAKQDIKRKLSVCFVLPAQDASVVRGYYTLSNGSIPLSLVPATIRRKLPESYTAIPITLLGRLAVGQQFQGQGIGKLLLIDALRRCFELSKSMGSFAVVVDPLDKDAENFYAAFGFEKLPDSGKMFIPMQTVKQLF